MLKSACIETLFTELPWQERFMAAKNAGFDYIEFWGWEDKDLDEIIRLSKEAEIKIAGFNGDSVYSLIDPSNENKYLEYLKKSIKIAKKIGAESLTVHSNGLGDGGVVLNSFSELSDTIKICSMFNILNKAAKIAEKENILLNLEALNITVDHIGNFLKTTQMAAEIVALINSPNLKILYDVYHMQLNEGSICDNLTRYIDFIGHIHIADAPGRHEPGTGEINYPSVIKHLKKIGYKNKVGFELFPKESSDKAVILIMNIFK